MLHGAYFAFPRYETTIRLLSNETRPHKRKNHPLGGKQGQHTRHFPELSPLTPVSPCGEKAHPGGGWLNIASNIKQIVPNWTKLSPHPPSTTYVGKKRVSPKCVCGSFLGFLSFSIAKKKLEKWLLYHRPLRVFGRTAQITGNPITR